MIKEYNVDFITHESNTSESYVPCGNCIACCTGLTPYLTSEEFESAKYIYTFLNTLITNKPVIAIPRMEDGCIYLRDGKCSIYNDRPKACRQFDCRKGHYKPFKELAIEKFGVYNEDEPTLWNRN